MVDLLDVDMTKPENAANEPDGELSLDMKVARGGTYALWSLCKSKRNRLLIKKAGGISFTRLRIIRTIQPWGHFLTVIMVRS